MSVAVADLKYAEVVDVRISRTSGTGTLFPVALDCTSEDELEEAPELHGIGEFGHGHHIGQGKA